MQIYSKNNKNCFSLISWPIFILFVLSDRASKLVHKILKFINYANLCKFTEPRKGPGGAIGFFYFIFFIIIIIFFFFFSCPFRGVKFIFFSL